MLIGFGGFIVRAAVVIGTIKLFLFTSLGDWVKVVYWTHFPFTCLHAVHFPNEAYLLKCKSKVGWLQSEHVLRAKGPPAIFQKYLANYQTYMEARSDHAVKFTEWEKRGAKFVQHRDRFDILYSADFRYSNGEICVHIVKGKIADDYGICRENNDFR